MLLRATGFLLLALLCLANRPVQAQQYIVVQSCGALPSTPALGSAGTIAVDQNGNLCELGTVTATATISASSAATVASSQASLSSLGTQLIVKASAGNLYGFYCTAITGGSAGFCTAVNSATSLSTGALTGTQVLDTCAFDTSTKGCSLSRIPGPPRNYSNGIIILCSSAGTPFTFTTGTDTCYISADYK